MNAQNDLDQQLNAFLREGPMELPYQSFDAVRDRTEQTSQRVVIGPWRTPVMNRFATFGVGALAVVAVLFVGAQLFGTSNNPPGSGNTTPQPSPTATVRSSPTPMPVPPLSQTFTSKLYGVSLSYPGGWSNQAATKHWTRGTFPLSYPDPRVDWLNDPTLTTDLFLAMASQPLGDTAPEDWVSEQMASDEGCQATEPITLDGATGLAGCNTAVVTVGGRGYWIEFYTGSEAPALDERAWFQAILATVQLHPEDAVD